MFAETGWLINLKRTQQDQIKSNPQKLGYNWMELDNHRLELAHWSLASQARSLGITSCFWEHVSIGPMVQKNPQLHGNGWEHLLKRSCQNPKTLQVRIHPVMQLDTNNTGLSSFAGALTALTVMALAAGALAGTWAKGFETLATSCPCQQNTSVEKIFKTLKPEFVLVLRNRKMFGNPS